MTNQYFLLGKYVDHKKQADDLDWIEFVDTINQAKIFLLNCPWLFDTKNA